MLIKNNVVQTGNNRFNYKLLIREKLEAERRRDVGRTASARLEPCFLQVRNGATRITGNCRVLEKVIWRRATLSLIDKGERSRRGTLAAAAAAEKERKKSPFGRSVAAARGPKQHQRHYFQRAQVGGWMQGTGTMEAAIWPPIYNNLGTFAPVPSPTPRPFPLNVYEIYSSLIPKLVTLALVIKKK